MDCLELREILDQGKDTTHQFKANFSSIDALAVEISAFANTGTGSVSLKADFSLLQVIKRTESGIIPSQKSFVQAPRFSQRALPSS